MNNFTKWWYGIVENASWYRWFPNFKIIYGEE